MAHDKPTLEDVLRALVPPCEHEIVLQNVSAILVAAALRHGGHLTFTVQELQDASNRALSIIGSPTGILVKACSRAEAEADIKEFKEREKAPNAPSTETPQ